MKNCAMQDHACNNRVPKDCTQSNLTCNNRVPNGLAQSNHASASSISRISTQSNRASHSRISRIPKAPTLLALILSLGLCVLLSGCVNSATSPSSATADNSAKVTSETSANRSQISDGTLRNVTVDDATGLQVVMEAQLGGAVNVERPARESSGPMGEPGTWTVLVYMCGSDLESEEGSASEDLNEMMAASTGENVRFVVQTGGASTWQANEAGAGANERVVIQAGAATTQSVPAANMADTQTLADFVRWGVTTYPAANMGLVLWDHGGGSLEGACWDEGYEDDSLTLREIDGALLSAYDAMTDNFRFLGFDACLMSTIETANVGASYADYLFASEEIEPGGGWDYAALGTYLGAHNDTTALDLGREISDSYLAACEETGDDVLSTLAVTDLSRIDAFLAAYGELTASLYERTVDLDALADFARDVRGVESFGGNNRAEGYTNMVDLQGIVEAAGNTVNAAKAQEVSALLDELVAYKAVGAHHRQACGLATYWPLSFSGADTLEALSQVTVNPSYLALVDRNAYCSVHDGDVAAYDDASALEAWGSTIYTVDAAGDGSVSQETPGYWDAYDDESGQSRFIAFTQEPTVGDDGTFGFQLTPEALDYTAAVHAWIYLMGDTDEDTYELGYTSAINQNWDTGAFSDAFDGTWVSLPDGQCLPLYAEFYDTSEGVDICAVPVELDGEAVNLRIACDFAKGTASILGVWDGVDDSGMVPRVTTYLEAGDEIVPLYLAPWATGEDGSEAAQTAADESSASGANLAAGTEATAGSGTSAASSAETDADAATGAYLYGEAYRYDGDATLTLGTLPDGEYAYSFLIDDVFGSSYLTDAAVFEVRNGEVLFAL